MSPQVKRVLIPSIVIIIALAIVAIMALSPNRRTPPPADTEQPAETASETAAEAGDTAQPAEGETSPDESAETPPAVADSAAATADPPAGEADPPAAEPEIAASAPRADLDSLIAVAPDTGIAGHDLPTQTLGSLDPNLAGMELKFSRAGAGIQSVTFSDIWETAVAKRQAEAYHAAIKNGQQSPDGLPDDSLRYVLQEARLLKNSRRPTGVQIPILAANLIQINDGPPVNIFDYNSDPEDKDKKTYIWAETAPGQFETLIQTVAGEQILRITRRFILGDNFDITIDQKVTNLTDAPLTVRLSQYGPGGLRLDRSRYMDRRRYRFGYLLDPALDPTRQVVQARDNSVLLERRDILKSEQSRIWPNDTSRDENYELSWFGATNRYFALTVHPVLDEQGAGARSLTGVVDAILHEESIPDPNAPKEIKEVVFTHLVGAAVTIQPQAEHALDIGLYAGPLDRHILEVEQPFISLAMDKLILYQMSSCCAICTFQWLAHWLLAFLTLLHGAIVFDWAIAIIILVMVVRALLHPITRKSQISMQRFGKVMGELKPEIDKLQKKYPNDPKKLQAEQMKLMRTRGANPMQMMGCLPMFLQTPIWIALYAMLYFVFDLRQEPGFFGVFQLFWDWPFLADLSSADHFFGELDEPVRFLMWNVTGINFLPILMGLIFFFQQKYMSPPPSPTMTKEQASQQKMMKIMMVVMFPLMLYSAPSGLTLYILTSSSIGILESRYIRKHIKEMDLNPPKKKRSKAKSKDAQGRAYAAAIQRMEDKRRKKQKGPEKRYKKRDK